MYIYKAIKVMHLNKERPVYNAIKNVEWTEEELQDLELGTRQKIKLKL